MNNNCDDDFSDYYYDSMNHEQLEQEDYSAITISDIGFREFSKMNDKEKIDYLYSLIRYLYLSFSSINEVLNKRC